MAQGIPVDCTKLDDTFNFISWTSIFCKEGMSNSYLIPEGIARDFSSICQDCHYNIDAKPQLSNWDTRPELAPVSEGTYERDGFFQSMF
jgi:hypothetical protein